VSDTIIQTDVVVVGAGFTGLSAALALVEAGLNVAVLEARDRVGGRVEATVNGLGERIDTGGQYFCVDMPEVAKLVRDHGMTVVEGLHHGASRVEPKIDQTDGFYEGLMAIRDRANGLDFNDPAIAGLSVRAWTDLQPDSSEARRAYLGAMEGLWCQPPDTLPFWYLVSNDQRITNEVPELQYFLRETMQGLAEKLAAKLGDRVRLGEAVAGVEHDGQTVVVRTAAERLHAGHVVLALPPTMAARIAFDPPLPARTGHALSAWSSGKVIKALLRYERPFWRDGGFSGSIFFLNPLGLYVCDASHDDDHPALVAFAGGALAAQCHEAGPEAAKDLMLGKMADAIGTQALNPLDFTLRDWTDDRWSGGGYSDTIVEFGAKDAEDVLCAGLPGITFASSELSPSYPGYIEGAIVAGRAAAARVVTSLRRRLPTSSS
jgi:monoamine oxidase